MSHDFMFFDPSAVASFPTDLDSIMPAFGAHLEATEADSPAATVQATERLGTLVADLATRYGAAVNGEPWNTWPPIVSGGGALVTLNVGLGADLMNMTIEAAEFAHKHGLILIDPQGNQPVLSTPDGQGLLDF